MPQPPVSHRSALGVAALLRTSAEFSQGASVGWESGGSGKLTAENQVQDDRLLPSMDTDPEGR